MFKFYKESNNKLLEKESELLTDNEFFSKGTWISTNFPTKENLLKLSKITKINYDFLLSSLDEEESAHIDKEDDSVLIVLDVPSIETNEDGESFITKPFIISYNDDYYVTVSQFNNTLIPATILKTKGKGVEPQKHARLTLNIIYQLSKEFISCLKRIDERTKKIEKNMQNSMKNKELFELMDINKTLVYFATALNSNKTVLNKLLRSPNYKRYEEDNDLMEDTEVELNQAIEMCNIYRGILAVMMDANASIINNNLNLVMKTLTTITIVLSIPTLIASIFGMNFDPEYSPLYHNKNGFYIIIGVAAILAIIFAIALIIYTNKKNRRK